MGVRVFLKISHSIFWPLISKTWQIFQCTQERFFVESWSLAFKTYFYAEVMTSCYFIPSPSIVFLELHERIVTRKYHHWDKTATLSSLIYEEEYMIKSNVSVSYAKTYTSWEIDPMFVSLKVWELVTCS